MNEQFFWPRLIHLLRGDLINIYRNVAVVAATLGCLMLVAGLLAAGNRSSLSSYNLWVLGMLLIWGPIFASKAFQELHDKTRCETYLLLPASALEKMVSRMLISIVAFPLFVLAFVTFVSWINYALGSMMFDFGVPVYRFGARTWDLLGHFVVMQSVFLLGGAWFRKAQYSKTALSVTLLLLGLACLMCLAFYFFFFGLMAPSEFNGEALRTAFIELSARRQTLVNIASTVWQWAYGFLLPLFCWVVAWLRIRETQVSHGV